MEFLFTILGTIALLFILLFVIPFLYFFVTGVLTIRKIQKKIQVLSVEYNAFVIHRNVAIDKKIAFTEPFSVTVETNNTIMKISNISQLEYLGSLKRLVKEIDEMLSCISTNLKTIPTLIEAVDYFNQVKQGLAEANPYN